MGRPRYWDVRRNFGSMHGFFSVSPVDATLIPSCASWLSGLWILGFGSYRLRSGSKCSLITRSIGAVISRSTSNAIISQSVWRATLSSTGV